VEPFNSVAEAYKLAMERRNHARGVQGVRKARPSKAVEHDDPYCSTRCCKIDSGVELQPAVSHIEGRFAHRGMVGGS
jgi:hypothetical protein